VKLWQCNATNQNQQWKKINVGGGAFRLQKRNAAGFSIDGGAGGANDQNLRLQRSNNNNWNQHWLFSSVQVRSTFNKNIEVNENIIGNKLFPNPVENILNVAIGEEIISDGKITIANSQGVTVMTKKMQSNNASLEVGHLASGIYFIQITNVNTIIFVKKFIKK